MHRRTTYCLSITARRDIEDIIRSKSAAVIYGEVGERGFILRRRRRVTKRKEVDGGLVEFRFGVRSGITY
jgi:hypothetical protein